MDDHDDEPQTFLQHATDEVIAPLLTTIGIVGGLGGIFSLAAGLLAVCGAASGSTTLLRASATLSGLGALGGLLLTIGAAVVGALLTSDAGMLLTVVEHEFPIRATRARPPTAERPLPRPLQPLPKRKRKHARTHLALICPCHHLTLPLLPLPAVRVHWSGCSRPITHYAHLLGNSLLGLSAACALGALVARVAIDSTCKLANACADAGDDPSEIAPLSITASIGGGGTRPPRTRLPGEPRHATAGRASRTAREGASVELGEPVVGCRLSNVEEGLAISAPSQAPPPPPPASSAPPEPPPPPIAPAPPQGPDPPPPAPPSLATPSVAAVPVMSANELAGALAGALERPA